MLEIWLPAFVTLFVVIDPISLAPMFIAVTAGRSAIERRRIAMMSVGIALGLLLLFAVAGEAVLQTLGIGMPAFRISGGLMLFLIALEMLFEKRTERRSKTAHDAQEEADEDHDDPSVFPLATPLIAGPGAFASIILLMGQYEGDLGSQAIVISALLAVLVVTLGAFFLAAPVERLLGKTGTNVTTRLLGLLCGALAVQFVLDGLRGVGLIAGGTLG